MPILNLVEPLSQGASLWGIGVALFLTCSLFFEVGNWLGRRQRVRRSAKGLDSEGSDAKDYIVSSVFRLLALLMGITFAIALDRFDSRSDWAAAEATAIRTVYLRADLLNEPHRSRLRSTLGDYARARLVPDDASRDELISIQAGNDRIRARLWRETRAALSSVQDVGMAAGFVSSMSSALEVGGRRSLAARVHIPSQIMDMLIVYLVAAIGVLGYLLGLEGSRRRYATHFLIILFVLAFLLIIDIDRPRSGPIKVPTLALEELIAEMDAYGSEGPDGVAGR